ncbi:MAG: hypothetical protein NVS2B17_26060 [Candidatus Velthaea sp.]
MNRLPTFICRKVFGLAIISPTNIHADDGFAKTEAYYKAHDWDGMVRYVNSWSQAEPNNAMEWNALGGG